MCRGKTILHPSPTYYVLCTIDVKSVVYQSLVGCMIYLSYDSELQYLYHKQKVEHISMKRNIKRTVMDNACLQIAGDGCFKVTNVIYYFFKWWRWIGK